jgi:predicted SAM-dependent methyltransferase
MSVKTFSLRAVNSLARLVGVQVVPTWQLSWGYSEREALETARQSELRGVRRRRAPRINVGCGPDIRVGWLNVDARPLQPDSEVFVCAELLLLDYYVEDGCATEVLAQDVLEHFSWRDVDELVRILAGKLAPGGRLVVQSPDSEALFESYQRGRLSFAEFQRLVYGDQTYPANTHRAAFTLASVRERLEHAGLVVEEVNRIDYNVRAVGRKP